MHGREGEEKKRRRHMWPVAAPATAASAPAAFRSPVALPENPSSDSSSPRSFSDSFLKDGRKIRVGDCALFQAGNAPPFIGIIRWFKAGKEDYINLCVNWLYRPVDVKLAKGVFLEAAPNEVFYSFHKDVIPAASLLHPCKVAFLRKGVEPPAGISSFVCRRVYDITNKCLWWLTDQDYINERQEEVDQLLDKTRLEMHTAVQSGGCSPKPLNGPASTQQLKSSSESVHNTGSSLPSQSKGKRKDRSDQSTELIERECSSKLNDGDSTSFKSDSMIKAEIVKITDKGGLVSYEGVEKLVNLMQLHKTEKKIDVAGRILVADVIAATDRDDCLSKFVELSGLLILDEWLREVHKSKSSDGSSPNSDKTVEELLLALLRALAKLPVNLQALQKCNIGKSVNNLRSHKNLEIQKKSRSLIDTWKKRVDAEMKNSDPKSVASGQPVWQAKPGSDVPHAAGRRTGSTEVAAKNTVTQTAAAKTQPGKLGHSDSTKTAAVSQGSSKAGSTLATSVAVGLKDPLCKAAAIVGSADMATTAVKEEKSSSSSQSQNNSQTCSGDHAKTVGTSGKEDTRSSTAGSAPSKSAGSSSRYRRSGNGVTVTSISGVPKETHLSKSRSLNKSTALEKSSQLGLTCEKPIDMLVAEHGNNHRLIVKLPNTVRSPTRSTSGGCSEDPPVSCSRASSPGISDKHELGECRIKVKGDSSLSNNATDTYTELCQSNDVKLPTGAGGMRSPTADEPHSRSSEETGKMSEATRPECSSAGNEKEVLSTHPRTSSLTINALIDSCRNSLEDSTSVVEDENGMNLLASVAAGEISKSNLTSPTDSPGASPVIEDPSGDVKLRVGSDNDVAESQKSRLNDDDSDQSHVKSDESDVYFKKEEKSIVFSYHDRSSFPVNNIDMVIQDSKLSAEVADYAQPKSELKFDERKDEKFCGSKLAAVEKQDNDKASPLEEKLMKVGQALDHLTVKEESLSADECKPDQRALQMIDKITCSSEVDPRVGYEHGIAASCNESEKLVIEKSNLCATSKEVPELSTSSDQKQHLMPVEQKTMAAIISNAPEVSHPDNGDETRTCMSDNNEGSSSELQDGQEHNLLQSNLDDSVRKPTTSCTAGVAEDSKMTDAHESSVGLAIQVLPSNCTSQEIEHQPKPAGSRLSEVVEGGREDLVSSAGTSSVSVTAEPNAASKLTFDLNEGINGDEGNHGEDAISVSATIELPTLSSFANPISNGSPAPITVAAPAKGSFVPPEILPKSKGEAGWKGSAATSAFRPAEPRKLLETPLNVPDFPSDNGGKQCRLSLDIDLNEPDDRVLEEMTIHSSSKPTNLELGKPSHLDVAPRISGGLDLDLNIVNEDAENGQYLASTSNRLEVPLLAGGTAASSEFPNREANMLRDFDLNNGPGLDEVSAEPVPRNHSMNNTSSVPFIFPVASVRMNTAEMGSVSSWFPPGTSYPAVAIPPFMSNREHSYPIVAAPGGQRILGPITSSSSFGGSGDVYRSPPVTSCSSFGGSGDIYRSPVLSPSPPMAFTPATFPYAGFPYASNYVNSSVAGSGFPTMPPPLVGSAGTVLSNYRSPHIVSLPESSTSGGSDNARKWMTPSLDLNAGPGSGDVEGKDDGLPLASRQFLAPSTQPFSEEQMRLYALQGGGSLKRKEPEGGWDTDRSSYKQLSWQ